MEHIVHSHIGDGKSLVLAQRKAQQTEDRFEKVGLDSSDIDGNGGESLVPTDGQPIAPTIRVNTSVDATTFETIWTRRDVKASAYYTTFGLGSIGPKCREDALSISTPPV